MKPRHVGRVAFVAIPAILSNLLCRRLNRKDIMNNQRKETIAADVLRLVSPNTESTNSVRALQRKLHRNHGGVEPITLSERLVSALVPEVDKLVQAGSVSEEEARDFTAEVLGEIIGTSIGQRACEGR
jgi:hypothetical protein